MGKFYFNYMACDQMARAATKTELYFSFLYAKAHEIIDVTDDPI